MAAPRGRAAVVVVRLANDAPTVSVIIPTLNEAGHIADLLGQLRLSWPDAELLVVDGGSQDETVRQALPRSDQLLICEPGRARQMNLGARAARGEFLFFLHADSAPQFDQQSLMALLMTRPAWGFFPLRLSGQRFALRVIEAFINMRSRLTRIGTGDQMLFMQRETYRQTGGFDDIPLMEDIAYCKRLKAVAAPLVPAAPVLTSSRRWEEQGIARTVLRMWGLRLAYFAGVSPERLWYYYYGR